MNIKDELVRRRFQAKERAIMIQTPKCKKSSSVIGTLTTNAFKVLILNLICLYQRILFDGHKCASTTCRYSCTSIKRRIVRNKNWKGIKRSPEGQS